jgi:YbbR domain-containing protein
MEKTPDKQITPIVKKSGGKWPKNLILKLLSLCFALFLWYFVVGEDKVDRTIFVPLEIVNLPEDLVIANQYKRELEVTVNGPRSLIKSLDRRTITRSVNLSEALPGTRVVKNDNDSMSFPRGVRVMRVQPTHIILLLDKLISKSLRIKAVTSGKLPKGYNVTSISLEPPAITVTGPLKILEDQNLLTTNPIDLSSLTKSSIINIGLNLEDDIAALIGDPIVTANIVINEKLVEKTIKNIPIILNHTNPNIAFKLKPKSLMVKAVVPYGLANDPQKLKTFFEAVVNAGALPAGTHKLKVKVTPTRAVTIKEIKPEMIIVELLPATKQLNKKIKGK